MGTGRRAAGGKRLTSGAWVRSAGAASSWPAVACLLHPCQGLSQQQHLCLRSQNRIALGRREDGNS